MAYIETNGIRTWKKKRKFLTVSVLLAIITLVSVISSFYFAYSNGVLQNTLYNYSPFIYSNSTSSILYNEAYTPDSTVLPLYGLVNVDLNVLSPYDGMLTINVKYLNFTDSSVSHYLNMSLLNKTTVSYFSSSYYYQYLISKDVMNTISDNLFVQAIVYLNSGILQQTLKNSDSAVTFYLGDITFQANLYEAQINKNYTQDFTEGVYCDIRANAATPPAELAEIGIT